MAKMKKVLLMLLKGGNSQGEVAAVLHVSKRDVSEAAKATREHNLTYERSSGMDPAAVEDKLFPKEPRQEEERRYLQPDMGSTSSARRSATSCSSSSSGRNTAPLRSHRGSSRTRTRASASSSRQRQRGWVRPGISGTPLREGLHRLGGDVAKLTDKITGRTTRVYVLVVVLPFSGLFWAHGFTDMRQQSWLEGHMAAFEMFGGVPKAMAKILMGIVIVIITVQKLPQLRARFRAAASGQ